MTMKTPEMDVVRFNESDVIVASGNHKYATAAGWGIGVVGDATMTFSNGKTDTKNLEQLSNDISFGYLNEGSVFTNNNGQSVTLGDLVRGGDADGKYTYVNGSYETFDNGHNWVWRQ